MKKNERTIHFLSRLPINYTFSPRLGEVPQQQQPAQDLGIQHFLYSVDSNFTGSFSFGSRRLAIFANFDNILICHSPN